MNRRSFFLAYTVTNSSVSMLAGRPLQSWVPCSYRKIHRSLMDFIFLLPCQVCMFLWSMDVPFCHRIEQDTFQTPVYLQQLGWLWGQREGREPLLCSEYTDHTAVTALTPGKHTAQIRCFGSLRSNCHVSEKVLDCHNLVVQ